MKILNQLNHEERSSESNEILDQVKKKIGMIPNLYQHIAHSPNVLKGIIDFGNALNNGELNKREVQAIDLVISEENECQYCLAAHTAVAKMLGFTEEDTIKLRKATIDDPKLRALTQLAKEILNRKGFPSEKLINNFFSAGYSKAALVELIGHISNMIFNNYIDHLSEPEIDFPKAPNIS